MKNRIFTILLGLVCALGAGAYRPQLDGTMMPYDFADVDSVAPWSADMQPVYVAYVARHGARYLSSEKKVRNVRDMLEKARIAGSLTDEGYAFMELAERVDSVNSGRWGALSEIGIDEERCLGREMVALCPRLFDEGRISAEATYVPRVVMTMYELCHQIACERPGVEISTAEGKRFNPVLRFFTTDSAYVDYLDRGSWKAAYDRFCKENVPAEPARRILGDGYDRHELQKFSMDAYGLLQSLAAAGMKGEADRWFTEREYQSCWAADNLKHYYQRSVSRLSDLPARSAEPLLNEIMGALEKARQGEGEEKARMWFGHAETVMPLFAAMRLPGCYAPDVAPEEVGARWRDWEVSPLGANLLMVLLQDSEGKSYISLRLNGRWISLGQGTVMRWEYFDDYIKNP